MSKIRYLNKGKTELNDNAIIKDLEKAREMYENGELFETADLLQEIAGAITDWKDAVQ